MSLSGVRRSSVPLFRCHLTPFLSQHGGQNLNPLFAKRKAREDNPEQFLPEPQTDVFMAVAETLGYMVKNNVEDYSAGVPNDLDKIVGAYKRGE